MTKTIIAALLATLALAIASPTAADDTTTGYYPGDWLMRACQSEETSYIAYCTGYAAGVLEAYGCLTPIGLRFILVDWLKSNPQQSHRPARDLVLLAFKEHKDCGAPKGATRRKCSHHLPFAIAALALSALASEASAEQRTFYDASGKVVGRSATDSQGTTTNYDSRGRVITRETTSGNQTTIYDAGGRNVGRFTTSK